MRLEVLTTVICSHSLQSSQVGLGKSVLDRSSRLWKKMFEKGGKNRSFSWHAYENSLAGVHYECFFHKTVKFPKKVEAKGKKFKLFCGMKPQPPLISTKSISNHPGFPLTFNSLKSLSTTGHTIRKQI